MESELSNQDSQVQMQQECVKAKDAERNRIKEQINQVKCFCLPRFHNLLPHAHLD